MTNHKAGSRNAIGRAIAALLIIASASLASCNKTKTLEGDYMIADKGSELLMQITSDRDGEITGLLTTASVDTKGKVSSIAVPITGTERDGSLNLTARNGTGLFSTSSQITGTAFGEEMRLTFIANGNATPMTLKRVDLSEFPKLVEQLSARSTQVRTDIQVADARQESMRSLAEEQRQIDRLANAIKAQTERLLAAPAKIDDIVARYGRARARIDSLALMREKVAPDSADADDRINQINDAIQDVVRQANDIHRNVLDGRSSIIGDQRETSANISLKLAVCTSNATLACDPLRTGLTNYRSAFDAAIAATYNEAKAFGSQIPNPTE